MTTDQQSERDALISAARYMDSRSWVPATSGNLSVRRPGGAWVSPTGASKGELGADELIAVDEAGHAAQGRPSAETLLHLLVYRRFPEAGAVLHSHGPHAVALSRIVAGDIELHGYELAKVLQGVADHETPIRIPVIANDQDMPRLVPVVESALGRTGSRWGFVLRGHGLYAWGRTVRDARRHLEALDALFGCQLMEMR